MRPIEKKDYCSQKWAQKKIISKFFAIIICVLITLFILFTILITLVQLFKTPAIKGSEGIKSKLILMAVLVSTTLVLYMILSWWMTIRNNKIIYHLSIEDQTTGLLNRTAYEQYAESRKNKELHCISVIYIDANGLHETNNHYGHEKGDCFLVAIANTLKKYFLANSIYRIGGDEFLVILENSHYESVAGLTAQAAHELESIHYFISYGISYREKAVGVSFLTKEADEKMLDYKKKYYDEKCLTMRKTLKKDD